MKNPVFLALLVAGIVFVVTYYYYNYYYDPTKDTKNKKNKKEGKEGKEEKDGKHSKKDNKKHNKKKGIEINEVMIISATVAGLITWYIASSYFTNDNLNNTSDDVVVNNNDVNEVMSDNFTSGRSMRGGSIKDRQKNKISHLDSDDSTRSYNMIGSGVNIPRADLKIPSVLIDYK